MKLKGFTLTEIIIAMLLSGILLSLAVKIAISVSSVYSIQKKASDQNNKMLLLHTILKENFDNSIKISFYGNKDLHFLLSNLRQINISFQSHYMIISDTKVKDTLELQCNNLRIERFVQDTSFVSKISFSIMFHDLDYPFFFVKEYSDQILFKVNN